MVYVDVDTQFVKENFQHFYDIVEDYNHTVSHEWVKDLNTHDQHLSFKIGYHTYPTHYVDGANGSFKAAY